MFWILATAMLLVAVAFVSTPLLRARGGADALRQRRAALEQARRNGVLSEDEYTAKLAQFPSDTTVQASGSRLPAALLALGLVAGSLLLYRQIGEPRALDTVWQNAAGGAVGRAGAGAADAAAPDMDQAVAGLADRLRRNPDDLDGWMLLGRAYKSMERFEPAREAMSNAFRLAPENPEVMIDYAEAQVLASDSRRFEGESLELLQRALQREPHHPRGLWLSGIAAYQDGDFLQATATWEHLLAEMPPEAEARAALEQRIAETRQRAGLAPAAPAATSAMSGPAATPSTPAPTDPAASSAAGPRLTVSVDISAELKSRVAASDVLFVFARAAEGPRMPLAIQRLPAGALPVTVTLDDSTSMMPSMKLSTMPQVVVGARISKSGQATPQAGDFEVLSAPMSNTQSAPVVLVIDKVVP